jgi:hypothetical protein
LLLECLFISYVPYFPYKSCILHSIDSKSARERLLLYILYSYGVPCLVVSLKIIITAVITDGQSYGYGDGGKTCFISKQMSLICTFIAPVALVCITNVFFFLTPAISIASTPKVQNDSYFAQSKIHFTVYVKLFIITESAWLIQIVDSFLPLTAFSIHRNIVYELVTESFTNQKTRLTIVHERLFSINRLVPLQLSFRS